MIGITQPDWTRLADRRSRPEELERYVRLEFRDSDTGWLLVRPSRIEAAPAGRTIEPLAAGTLFERLARVVASFF